MSEGQSTGSGCCGHLPLESISMRRKACFHLSSHVSIHRRIGLCAPLPCPSQQAARACRPPWYGRARLSSRLSWPPPHTCCPPRSDPTPSHPHLHTESYITKEAGSGVRTTAHHPAPITHTEAMEGIGASGRALIPPPFYTTHPVDSIPTSHSHVPRVSYIPPSTRFLCPRLGPTNDAVIADRRVPLGPRRKRLAGRTQSHL